MANNDNQRFYPVRDKDDPSKVTLAPISEGLYQSIYPDIWRTQKQMRKIGRCICPQSKLWTCDGDCAVCEFCANGNQVPIDTPIDDSEDLTLGDTISDDAPSPEVIAINLAMLDALYEELDKLDPDERLVCDLLMHHSERESADLMGIPRSTFKHRWSKIRDRLYEKLKDWYY